MSIAVDDLVVRRGRFELRCPGFSVPTGASLGILGPSGSGKTLLLETILGLRKAGEGSVFIDGRDIRTLRPEDMSVAYLPQDLAIFPHLSVFENIAFRLRLEKGLDEDTIRRRVRKQAIELGIERILERDSVAHLSGGEQQRVALARALIARPRLLFLDEPFGALDSARKRELHRQVRDLQLSLGLTMLFVTHDLEEAAVMADEIILLREGRVEQRGAPRKVFSRPESSWAARFLLYENLFRAMKLEGNRLRIGTTELRYDPGEETHPARDSTGEQTGHLSPGSGETPAGTVEHWFAVRAGDLHLSPPSSGDSFQCLEGTAGRPVSFGSGFLLPVRIPETATGPDDKPPDSSAKDNGAIHAPGSATSAPATGSESSGLPARPPDSRSSQDPYVETDHSRVLPGRGRPNSDGTTLFVALPDDCDGMSRGIPAADSPVKVYYLPGSIHVLEEAKD